MPRHHRVSFGDDDEGCRGPESIRRPAGMLRKAGGAGTEPNDPTINRLEYENSNTHWQVVRDGLWRCSLPLLLLWGPLIDRPGSRKQTAGAPREHQMGELAAIHGSSTTQNRT